MKAKLFVQLSDTTGAFDIDDDQAEEFIQREIRIARSGLAPKVSLKRSKKKLN